tara:strand:+ start:1912 stop:2724 length:813 start_codon:yes stop_codon:yes gene_type:complete
MKIPFIKANGAGNDFVIIDKNIDIVKKSKKIIKKLCDRRFGIGCDQLIILEKISSYYQVTFYNSDGSLGKNCGNGLRCAYKYLTEFKKNKRVVIKSKSFMHFGSKIGNDYKINVGEVSIDWQKIPLSKKIDTQNISLKNIIIPGVIKIMSANIGNPHCIILVRKIASIDLKKVGPKLVKHSLFPDQANITFVEIINSKSIKVLFWERGGGHTLACGSGTCATAFVLHHNNFTKPKIKIKTEQSHLETEIYDKTVYLKGPAEIVYQSVITL